MFRSACCSVIVLGCIIPARPVRNEIFPFLLWWYNSCPLMDHSVQGVTPLPGSHNNPLDSRSNTDCERQRPGALRRLLNLPVSCSPCSLRTTTTTSCIDDRTDGKKWSPTLGPPSAHCPPTPLLPPGDSNDSQLAF